MPFSRKLTPAAFPAFTTISRLARTEVCAGAMRVSWATGLPSAMRETQVVCSARICTVKVGGGFGAATCTVARAGLAPGWGGWAAGFLAEPVADAVGDAGLAEGAGAADADRVGGAEFGSGVVATEFVAGVPAGDAGPPISELAGPAVRVAADAGDEVGAGPEDGAGV